MYQYTVLDDFDKTLYTYMGEKLLSTKKENELQGVVFARKLVITEITTMVQKTNESVYIHPNIRVLFTNR